ncbi:MAG TPA: hypothetical protein PKV06_10185 [bacterium]|nr:hypothetical protein [bacterium]HNH30470.1 hypothetical protein [bacterium]
MEVLKVGSRTFKWNGITWAAQVELDNIWSSVVRSWANELESERRHDYSANELFSVMRLVYLPQDGDGLMTFAEFLQITVQDGESCKKKLTENVNVSEIVKRLFNVSNNLQASIQQDTKPTGEKAEPK